MPNINVLNEIQIKQDNNTTTSYKVGTVNGYYNPTNGKFYKEYPYVNEIEGASNLVYVDLGGNKLYIYKNSSFVNVSGSGGGSADNIVFGYYKEADGKFYEDSSYTIEIVPNLKNLYINLTDETIFRYDATNSEYVEISEANASGINYDNTTSGLTANNVQDAIDEVNNDLIAYGQGHNGIYRGKDLGTVSSVASLESFLSSHKVSNGDFSDIYLGDIIHIQDGTYNAEWIVAGFNTHKNKGANNVVSSNHIALIPKTILFSDKMNSTNTTEGGYKASYMHTTVMPTVTSKLNAVLGSHLLTRDILISNAISATTASGAYGDWTGASSSWEWVATRCELMSEVEVYGSKILSSSFFDIGEGCMKLPVFNFINHVHFARAYFWLRGVANSTLFCLADGSGAATYSGASNSLGVRPLILIG